MDDTDKVRKMVANAMNHLNYTEKGKGGDRKLMLQLSIASLAAALSALKKIKLKP